MTSITLHRASRILLAIDKAIKLYEPKAVVKVSIFSDSPEAEIKRKQVEFDENFSAVRELMRIRSRIRAVVGVKNAQSGVSDVLANQEYFSNLISHLNKVPGVAPRAAEQPEDEYGFRRRSRKVSVAEVLDRDAVVKLLEASKQRFSTSEQAVATEVEVSVVDADDSARYRALEVEARRRLDEISDQLRTLNSSERVEVEALDIDWLTKNNVV